MQNDNKKTAVMSIFERFSLWFLLAVKVSGGYKYTQNNHKEMLNYYDNTENDNKEMHLKYKDNYDRYTLCMKNGGLLLCCCVKGPH